MKQIDPYPTYIGETSYGVLFYFLLKFGDFDKIRFYDSPESSYELKQIQSILGGDVRRQSEAIRLEREDGRPYFYSDFHDFTLNKSILQDTNDSCVKEIETILKAIREKVLSFIQENNSELVQLYPFRRLNSVDEIRPI